MNDKLIPTRDDWRSLYKAAEYFGKQKCWQWMRDTDLLVLRGQGNCETSFCAILGNNQEFFALVIYLGWKGLAGYLRILNGELGPYDVGMLHSQRCLMASFEDKIALDDYDLKHIEDSGVNFKGPKSWPLFRSYHPGYYPWYLNKSEVVFLTHALNETTKKTLLLKRDLSKKEKEKEDLTLISFEDKRDMEWVNDFLMKGFSSMGRRNYSPVNEIKAKKVKRTAKKRNVIWETDIFYSPFPIQPNENERPYYPYIYLWVDAFSQEIIAYRLINHCDYPSVYQNSLLDLVEKLNVIPIGIHVRKKEAASILMQTSRKINVTLKVQDFLPALESAKKGIYRYFNGPFAKKV